MSNITDYLNAISSQQLYCQNKPLITTPSTYPSVDTQPYFYPQGSNFVNNKLSNPEPSLIKKIKTGPSSSKIASNVNSFQPPEAPFSARIEDEAVNSSQTRTFAQFIPSPEDNITNVTSMEGLSKQMMEFDCGELSIPPVIDENATLPQIAKNRASYSSYFNQMREKMLRCWQKQLEFLRLLEDLNRPECAMYWPVLDKVNPLIAGVVTKKLTIDENTLTVMKRTHRLLKSGPVYRTPQASHVSHRQSQYGKLGDNIRSPSLVKGKKESGEFETPFTSNLARKSAEEAKIKKDEESLDQLMAFILKDCNTEKLFAETGTKEEK